MSRWRIAVVAGLVALPFVVWAGIGSYYLWTMNWGFRAWWLMAACMATGYLLAWYWQRNRQLLHSPDFKPLGHWTDRDQAAWKIVESRAEAAKALNSDQLSDVDYYVRTAQDLANELARVYKPGAADPLGHVTIPEILAVVELATHDLAELVDQYVPGGHLLSINDWRRAKKAADWYESASNAWWVLSALFRPVETGARYAAARVGLKGPMQMLQDNLILWFHTAFLHRLGTYLVELNSGRLRVGVARYRQIMGKGSEAMASVSTPSAGLSPIAAQVTIALVGQVKAGKSSLINALLGERRALADVLPTTNAVERYELKAAGAMTKLVLLDTPGFGHAGPKADQVAATREAAQESDVVIVVLHATNPGRQADLAMVNDLFNWFAVHPELKRPPFLAAVTHIDLLSPMMEWKPPYDWRQPKRPKEENIFKAALAVKDQLGDDVAAVVPVCTAPGKITGIQEDLLPAIASRLEEARVVALLRCLHAEADEGNVRKVFHQLLAVGQEAARYAWHRLST